MASIIDACNESFNDKLSYLKFFIYGIPVYFCANFYLKGQMDYFYVLSVFTFFLLMGLLAQGIFNIRSNSKEILTFNPLKIIFSIIKLIIVMGPQLLLYYWLGNLITGKIKIPVEIPHINEIFAVIVWLIFCSMALTSFLAFSKNLSIKDGFDIRTIFVSSIDVLLVCLFAIPQFAIVGAIFVGPVAYLFWFFKLSFTHWGFVAYCSVCAVAGISIIANYMAQVAYEQIKSFRFEDSNDHVIGSLLEKMDTERHL